VRTVHAFFPATGWWGVKRRAQLAVSERLVDVTVFLNEQMAAHESTFGRRGVVIGNWVDDRFLQSPRIPADVDILVVGNCDPVKRHEVVLTAALEAGWTVAHVGSEAGCSDDERALLTALTSRDLLVARGVADPLPWLARCAVFAVPSHREGFSVALSEAIAMGCVCLTSAAPGLQWATRYPLVTQLAGASASEWRDALGTALAADITDEQRQGQRSMASEELSAASGVRNYMSVYRSGTSLSH
jgi:glycosyltransferase involved in cell wall biosynthesis